MRRILVWAAALPVVILCAVLSVACGKSNTIIVGSKADTEGTILGEIVAQHLDRRLSAVVERRLSLGSTAVLYQSILSGDISIYPEYTGVIETDILKEPPADDPQIVLERTRAQLRLAQLELMDPLGFDNPPAIVVRAADAPGIQTLSEVAGKDTKWKLGVDSGFENGVGGWSALSKYRLPMASAPRGLEQNQLFAKLEAGDVTMIAARATDGHLTSPDWKVLADDRKVFTSYQACLLVRQDKLAQTPQLKAALAELSGKFSADTMRKLNAQVDVEHRPPAAVAAEFLTQAGLR
jgi:glycine betaine/choline ABC-type transport system substrate-binding protein